MPLRRYLYVLTAVTAFIFFSCKEAPRNFNSNLLGPDQINLVNLDSFVAGLPQTSHSFKTVITTGASYTLLLGSYTSHTGNVQDASTLIRFDYSTISDTDKANFLNGSITVNDSWIVFTKTYGFGDTSATQLNFGAYKINTPWTSSGFTSDSLNNFSYGSNDVSLQKELATDSTNIYNVHIDPGTIQDEIKSFANGVWDNGLYLKPNSPGNTVWGFGAIYSSYPPAIAVSVNRGGVLTDTLYFNAYSDVSVLSGNLESTAQDFYLQTSLIGQAIISFDVSIIPSNAIINQAKLLLTVDPSNTVNGTSYISNISAYNIADSSSRIVDTTLSPITVFSHDSLTYQGDVTTFVQKWVTKRQNQGLLLSPQDGLTGLDLYAFKGSNASNASQRPRLIILYTKK